MIDKKYPVSLSQKAKAIILGSLLGDGSLKIQKGYKNARLSFRHSDIQREYFLWKVNALSEEGVFGSVTEQKPDGYSKEEKLLFQSQSTESLTEIFQLTNKSRKFTIRRKWLNMMTPLSLAIWWCDDGSLISNSRKGVFCSEGFDYDSHKILARYFLIKWGIECHIGEIKKKNGKQEQYHRLWISSTDELKKFLRIILPYLPVASMLPKVLLLYNDQILQQRWISEVVHLSQFSEQEVLYFLQKKKEKWQQFRK